MDRGGKRGRGKRGEIGRGEWRWKESEQKLIWHIL